MFFKYLITIILLIILILTIIINIFSFIKIEKYKNNNYLSKIKSNYCEQKNLENSYMPQKCCYFKNKKFICKDKNCRCKSKKTGICKLCYDD